GRLPGPGAVAVGAVGVGGDQEPPGGGVVEAAAGVPPAADHLHGERGGVVVGADADPPGVRGQIVDPVGNGLALAVAGEVVIADPGRGPLGPPLPPGVAELPDHLLLLD